MIILKISTIIIINPVLIPIALHLPNILLWDIRYYLLAGDDIMKATEGKIGRIFLIIRLEDGDVMPDCVERFAAEKHISVGQAIFVGGVGSGQVVVGPRSTTGMPPEPMLLPVDGVHEIVGVGTIAPGEDGKPVAAYACRAGTVGKYHDRMHQAGRYHMGDR